MHVTIIHVKLGKFLTLFPLCLSIYTGESMRFIYQFSPSLSISLSQTHTFCGEDEQEGNLNKHQFASKSAESVDEETHQ